VSYFTIIGLVVTVWILSPLLAFIIIGLLVLKKTGQKTILNKIPTKDGIIIILYGGFGLFSIISIYLKWLTSYRAKCSWWRLKEFGGKV
jgi:hypothetical protein